MQRSDSKRSPERQLEHHDVPTRLPWNNMRDSKRSPERQDSHRKIKRSDSSESPKIHRQNSQKERYQNAVDTIQNHVEAFKDRPPVTKNFSYQPWLVRSSPQRHSERPGSYQQWMVRSTPERQSKIGPPVMPKPKLYRSSSFNGHHHYAGHREEYYPDNHGGPYVISEHHEKHGDMNAGFNHHSELDLHPNSHVKGSHYCPICKAYIGSTS
ncbi:hypothetical protein B566_EDAN009373 [Ephemera danica]|nr:hypothetical protein B566_EDAN009373 [Ephemera danica]